MKISFKPLNTGQEEAFWLKLREALMITAENEKMQFLSEC
jgi:hypothetical protein